VDAQEPALNFHNHPDIKANVTFFNGPFKQELFKEIITIMIIVLVVMEMTPFDQIIIYLLNSTIKKIIQKYNL
jgi:hypothetical protein